jgi:hypothetical protein
MFDRQALGVEFSLCLEDTNTLRLSLPTLPPPQIT